MRADERTRITQWIKALKKRLYTKTGEIPLEYFTTTEQMDYGKAMRRRFRPVGKGLSWGRQFEYGWFRGSFEIPPQAHGKKVVVIPHTKQHALIFINGREAGAVDERHKTVTVTDHAEAGERFDFAMEVYAGNVFPPLGGPVPYQDGTEEDEGRPLARLECVEHAVIDEELFALLMDAQTLLDLHHVIHPKSLRAARIRNGLLDMTFAVDPESPPETFEVQVKQGRRILAELLECRNGSTVPTITCVGHGHLDVEWLWPLGETIRKNARTFANQLSLIEEYPDYVFLQSQMFLYDLLRRRYPDLYERVKEAVRKGNIVPEGGMWVECDTNVTGGESLIRQFLHGIRFCREELGYDPKVVWLPDTFGHTGTLPQIIRGVGMKYFFSAKLLWNYTGGEDFPYNTFWWEGIDGSRVLVHLAATYNGDTFPRAINQIWENRRQDDISMMLLPVGWGDGGGGPAREYVESLRRQKDLEGTPRISISPPARFFETVEREEPPAETYRGELYLPEHRGTYTSQARVKKYNRIMERLLRETEVWSTTAMLGGHTYPTGELDSLWKRLLKQQFHDILPGSSIRRVYEGAEREFEEMIEEASTLMKKALSSLATTKKGRLSVFNSLNKERTVLVPLPHHAQGATAKGAPLPVQRMGDTTLAEVSLPPLGGITLELTEQQEEHRQSTTHADASKRIMENEYVRISFDEYGAITSLFDKETGREIAGGKCNLLRLFRDIPGDFDAWDIDRFYEKEEVPLTEEASFEAAESGPLAAMLRIKRRIASSELTQEVWLRRNSRRIDFKTTVDWRERHRMLRVDFNVAYAPENALHGIQFGYLQRPTHRSRPHDADMFEVCHHGWSALVEDGGGFALMSDYKYGIGSGRGKLSLTLLRSPMSPDEKADLGHHEFTYSAYLWNGPFVSSNVIWEALDLRTPPIITEGDCKDMLVPEIEGSDNVVLETMKTAEDGSGDIIMRMYEAMNMHERCRIRIPFPVDGAAETNLLEEPLRSLPVREGCVEIEFGPFEVKTLRSSSRR